MEQTEQENKTQKIVVWAKVTGHPFWPARYCDQEEEDYHARFKQRKNDLLVHFFAAGDTGSYGWVIPSNVKDFDPSDLDVKGKKNKALKAAILAAQEYYEDVTKNGYFKPTLLIEGVSDDGVCCICKQDEFAGTILICDACDNEYHLKCLDPPISVIPEGDWFCPKCKPSNPSSTPSSSSSATTTTTALGKRSSTEQSKAPKQKKATKSRSSALTRFRDRSEDKCGICGTEGELIMCDFPGCPKVYHASCIWPKSADSDEQQNWICPRHSCCVCLNKEGLGGEEEEVGAEYRQCSSCILSCCQNHQHMFATSESEKCMFCDGQSPRAELGSVLHECWSKIATHYLSLPFMRPFLSTPNDNDEDKQGVNDLLDVLEKIRRLEYSDSSQFLNDLKLVRNRLDCLDQDNQNSHHPNTEYSIIREAFDTLIMSVKQVLGRHERRLQSIEAKLLKQFNDVAYLEVRKSNCVFGLHGHQNQRLPNLTPNKSLLEWKEFIANPPLKPSDHVPSGKVGVSSLASILVDMSNHTSEEEPRPLSQGELLDSHSMLLRQLMTSHAQLRSNWQQSREMLLSPPSEDTAITLGETHVVVELQIANQSLKSQLARSQQLLGTKTKELELSMLQCQQLREQNQELMAQLKK